MSRNPTGTSFETPSVPRKSRSPSARIVASRKLIPKAVATAPNVTPAHATRASSNMSPEQALNPSPPVAGDTTVSPATPSAQPVAPVMDSGAPVVAQEAVPVARATPIFPPEVEYGAVGVAEPVVSPDVPGFQKRQPRERKGHTAPVTADKKPPQKKPPQDQTS